MKERNKGNTDNSFMIDIDTARDRYQIGRDRIRVLAKEANAYVKIGKSFRIIPSKLDEYLLSLTEEVQ